MADSRSETEELSDAMKEKVLLNLLKNHLRQDIDMNGAGESVESVHTIQTKADSLNELDEEPGRPCADRETGASESQSNSSNPDPEKQKHEATTALEDLVHPENQPDTMVSKRRSGEAVGEEMTPSEKTEPSDSVNEASSPPEKEEGKPDLIKRNEEKLAEEESSLSKDQLKERHEKSQALRAQANNLYKESAFDDAAKKYSEALQLCPLSEEKDRSILHANRAAALMAANQNKEALPDLNRALELDPNYLKALERRARLNRLLENLDDSLKDYERLLELKPKHYAYIATIRELQEEISKRDEELKAKMLGEDSWSYRKFSTPDSLKQLGNVFLKPFGLSTENFSMVPNEGGGYSLQMKGQQ